MKKTFPTTYFLLSVRAEPSLLHADTFVCPFNFPVEVDIEEISLPCQQRSQLETVMPIQANLGTEKKVSKLHLPLTSSCCGVEVVQRAITIPHATALLLMTSLALPCWNSIPPQFSVFDLIANQACHHFYCKNVGGLGFLPVLSTSCFISSREIFPTVAELWR